MAIYTLLYGVSFFPYVLTLLIVMVTRVASGLIVFHMAEVGKTDRPFSVFLVSLVFNDYTLGQRGFFSKCKPP